MKEDNLRLRLVVRRHNLPEVRVLFSISLQDEPTIASLLEQVNDTVPLESPDWGLDDYVVEIEDSHGHAFECLHFQPVNTILDRDEEVIIRPLFTVDRKKRLLSGRHQISTDGKHLVDGVPFGRPRLRIPGGRPPVDIPPLKKRRITFDQEGDEDADEEDDDDDYGDNGSGNDAEDEDAPLMLTENGEDEDEPGAVRVAAVFDDADGRDEDEEDEQAEEEDEDLDEGEEGEADDLDEEEIDEAELLDELRDLQRDNNMLGDGEPGIDQESEPAQQTSTDPDPDADLARLNKITALRRAFPAVDCHVYEDVLRRNALNERMAYRELSKSYEASMSLEQMGELLASFSCPVLPSSNNFDAGADEAESDAESTSSLVKHYDQRGFPSGSILDGSASRVAAEALRKAGHAVRSPVHTKFDDGNANKARRAGKPEPSHELVASEDDDGSDDSDSSDSDSAEDESDDDEVEDNEEERDSHSDSDDTSSEEESDDSEDAEEDSGPEVASTKPLVKSSLTQGAGGPGDRDGAANNSSRPMKRKRGPAGNHDAVLEDQVSSAQDSSSSEDSSDSSSSSESDESSSDESSSDDSSERRATSTSTVQSAKLGLRKPNETTTQQQQPDTAAKRSPPGQGLSKTKARNARRKLALKARKAALAKPASPPSAAEASEVPSQVSQSEDSEFLKRKQALLEQLAKDNTASPSQPEDAPIDPQMDAVMDEPDVPNIQETPDQLPDSEATTAAMQSASQRRSKLDVGAGRRMLFASLGLKTPKTKADEDKIRGDLMKGVRPLVNHRISEASAGDSSNNAEAGSVPEEPEDEDPEAWRSKIVYRAVECVQEGVELSEPPFPFVQRWDPQQQNAWRNKRGGRGKRKQRNQTDFYEDDSALPSAKKQRVNDVDGDSSFAANANDAQGEDAELNYDDIPDSVPEKAPAEQPSHLTDMDDLPSLPKDLATLPILKLDEAKPGMVIAWKQMVVSSATNWAPQVLDLSAVIVSIDEATEELRVVLARRDRHLDGKEKTFDQDGNRVYDRFDAPDDDDEDADGENTEGYRTVQYSDIMDPRIVQQPLPSLQKATLHTIVESQDQADMVMADNDGLAGDNLEKEIPDAAGENSPPPGEQPEPPKEQVEGHAEAQIQDQHDRPEESSYGSVVPDSVPKVATEAAASVRVETMSDAPEDVSITDDRRHDISVMIQEAGFRADVTPSVAKEARFTIEDLSSPSRQLDEEMSDAAAAASHQGSRSPGQAQSALSPSALHEVSLPSDGATDEQPAAVDDHDTPKANRPRDVTPTVAYPQLPQLPVPTSSASSVGSGRQPDNDFSMDWGDDDLLHRSEELGEDIGAVGQSAAETNKDEATPTKPKASMADDSDNSFDSSPLPSLDEIFSTASNFRATQSPVQAKLSAALTSRNPEAKHDLEYEEIMRRVDESESWEDDQGQIKNDQRPPSSINWDERRGQIKEERWSQAAAVTSSTKAAVSKPIIFPKSRVASFTSPERRADLSA